MLHIANLAKKVIKRWVCVTILGWFMTILFHWDGIVIVKHHHFMNLCISQEMRSIERTVIQNNMCCFSDFGINGFYVNAKLYIHMRCTFISNESIAFALFSISFYAANDMFVCFGPICHILNRDGKKKRVKKNQSNRYVEF